MARLNRCGYEGTHYDRPMLSERAASILDGARPGGERPAIDSRTARKDLHVVVGIFRVKVSALGQMDDTAVSSI